MHADIKDQKILYEHKDQLLLFIEDNQFKLMSVIKVRTANANSFHFGISLKCGPEQAPELL